VAEVTLFIPGLQDPAILDDDTDSAVELNLTQQALHRGREYLCATDFAAKLSEPNLLTLPWDWRHEPFFLPSKASCGVNIDRIAECF